MDSNLLEQIRYLCRDRAAYEHLKAILVQQERVHQLSWEERYEKLLSAQSSDAQADIFSNIIAREKALAQLADAIQRSPSLELVLQVAVQVAQKLLQVDRVAIFRCHPDGRGEFAIDAIAPGVISIADMPERQLSLARHMIESTELEHSAQTIDSIRTSSLSSHIVTLLEQIGISSYAANKIYAGQEVWGNLVAFHGIAYHSWSESDRTFLSLISAQIGIAISLTNLRQQSQELTDDLQTLQIELGNLQQVVTEIAESKTNSIITPDPTQTSIEQYTASVNEEIITDATTQDVVEDGIEQIINPASEEIITDAITQDMVEDEQQNDYASNDLKTDDIEASQVEQDLEDKESEVGEVSHKEEITYLRSVPIFQNGLPPLFLASDSGADPLKIESAPESENMESLEKLTPEELVMDFAQDDIYYVVIPDDLKSLSDMESTLKESGLEEVTIIDFHTSTSENLELEDSQWEDSAQESISANVSEAEIESAPESENMESLKKLTPEELVMDFTQDDIYYVVIPDDLKSLSDMESTLNESGLEEVARAEIDIPERDPSNQNLSDMELEEPEIPNLEKSELENPDLSDSRILDRSEPENPEPEIIDSQSSQLESLEPEDLELEETSEQEAIAPESEELEVLESKLLEMELSDSEELEPIESEPIAPETKLTSPEFDQQEVIEAEINEIENESGVEQIDDAQIDLDTTVALDEEHDGKESAIEPQFMETILDIAGNDLRATEFLLEVIDTYLEDAPRLVQTIDKAIAISDHVRLFHALKVLRSSSEYIGALTLSHQCRQLESAVKANYVVLIYAYLSRVAIEAQRATDALRIARSRYKL